MKIKRIISTALTVIMLFATVAGLVPLTTVESDAAYSPSTSVGQSEMNSDELKAYVLNEYMTYNYATAEEMLNAELEKGYLDSSTSVSGMFTIFVNRYTGFLYYRNNFTGQILTSNPTDPGYIPSLKSNYDLMSQITVKMFETSNQRKEYTYSSTEWAAQYGQISVTAIKGGLRVNYTLGDTVNRFLLPGRMSAEKFSNEILLPMITRFEQLLKEYNSEGYIAFIDNPEYDKRSANGYWKNSDINNYYTEVSKKISAMDAGVQKSELSRVLQDLMLVSLAYNARDVKNASNEKQLEEWLTEFPIIEQFPIVIIDLNPEKTTLTEQRNLSNIIKKYCPEYNLTAMFEDEKACGYVHETVKKPYIRCAIEYTFNEDDSLSVRVPANSISFDESTYTLDSITPLKYFGAGNMTDEGFIFFPDGTGTVVDFEDFYNKETGKSENILVNVDRLFGPDYCYSSINGAHREQVTMPVYGLVGKVAPNAATETILDGVGAEHGDTLKSGYFAILEEGASLATLSVFSLVATHKYGNVYASYTPYPQDTYDLSQTLSVGSATKYKMVAKTKYAGSYVTRYTMLYDSTVGDSLYGENNYCETSYVGMADYYRAYLKENGTIGAFEAACEDLPLYIEALGSMKITTKFLTFPVEEEIPLTTFDDIITIYNELATARKHIRKLIADTQTLLEAETDELIREEYLSEIESYNKLLETVENVKNVNFRLTGFANDGMYYTYPTKASWQDTLGGPLAFQHLVNEGKRISKVEGQTLGIYPEFDFLYISNTAMFDGISQSDAGSRMVDNRYASKQVYNAILQEFETFYTMVVSTDVIGDYYSEFNEDYSQYGAVGLSASTLGSDLNSNFDKDNSINRDESRENIVALLQKMNELDGYDLMLDKGNIYSVKYATHLLNVATDSSHFKYSSYTVPFTGMILHGHVNYAGTPINYSGSTAYEILRSIESGASLYYIVCYQNTSHMKDDEMLNKYFGVDYSSWYSEILLAYSELNAMVGDLQEYEIVDHVTVISEREKEDSENDANYALIQAEYLANLELAIHKALNDKFAELEGDSEARVKLVLDDAKIKAEFKKLVKNADLIYNGTMFDKAYASIRDKYLAEYPGDAANAKNNVELLVDEVGEYESQYSFSTTSDCRDGDAYVSTSYTLDNNKVVIVTYKNGDDVVRFILNYNIYTVNVRLDGAVYTLDKYEYVRLDG
ncbi:MAG: hypothetical protein IJD51_06215 [Clostridia bacterium]|nr:hypothetical protein [Clostridia bacterium]